MSGQQPAVRRTVSQLVAVVLVMGALAWAAIPAYNWFCRVTGYGGETGVAETGSDVILDQTVKIRFDASKERGMAWEFKPLQREVDLRIGETGLAFFEAYNPTDRPIAGQASYNVAPYSAGSYFDKIACFCFTEQVLQPGERVEMPVTFFVDPAIVEDPEAKFVHTITLSYTFYEIDLPEGYAALSQKADTNLN
ncbi:cytochrome c oxidase assembly protein [Pseudodonghicola xiamenensis]|uniref:Cytochrome c oxidase assembly protein CtaG n=1 Tax=Pseudodonghicola xiamenensis TaxID=337702 RepID=A0A8J3H8R0_9RHOB|nr:cytochrome c oxidase assembly protein [Pseudodonghicola xiamenensis]GHG94353.1 cytochrome c oxidase assembly protein CtaG [Pseudodonghicola xiamenensis]